MGPCRTPSVFGLQGLGQEHLVGRFLLPRLVQEQRQGGSQGGESQRLEGGGERIQGGFLRLPHCGPSCAPHPTP